MLADRLVRRDGGKTQWREQLDDLLGLCNKRTMSPRHTSAVDMCAVSTAHRRKETPPWARAVFRAHTLTQNRTADRSRNLIPLLSPPHPHPLLSAATHPSCGPSLPAPRPPWGCSSQHSSSRNHPAPSHQPSSATWPLPVLGPTSTSKEAGPSPSPAQQQSLLNSLHSL